MELNLQPPASASSVSKRPFGDGEPVVSYLVRSVDNQIVRLDVGADEDAGFRPEGFVFCRWVHRFKAHTAGENPERQLKLTAENLFLTLADPSNEPSEANTPMLQFLSLMLERKRVLRPRGMTADRARHIFEHARTRQLFEIPAGDLSPEFFIRIRDQMGALLGLPAAPRSAAAPAAPAAQDAGAQPQA